MVADSWSYWPGKDDNLKVENYVLFGGLSEDFKPRRQPLRSPWGMARNSQGRSQDTQVFYNKDRGARALKDYCWLKKPDILMNLVLFYVWVAARVWTHWNHSFDIHLSYLGPASSYFPSCFPSGCAFWGGCNAPPLDGGHSAVLILRSLRLTIGDNCGGLIWLPRWYSDKELICQWRRCKGLQFNPWSERGPGGGNGNTLQYSCLGNAMDRAAWRPTVHGVSESWTWLSTRACTHTHTHTHTVVAWWLIHPLFTDLAGNIFHSQNPEDFQEVSRLGIDGAHGMYCKQSYGSSQESERPWGQPRS